MWFNDRSDIFVHCIDGHDLPTKSCDFSNIPKLYNSEAVFHEHVFNPYIF
jgi:hypothetical protein